jgi:hypothetical protein
MCGENPLKSWRKIREYEVIKGGRVQCYKYKDKYFHEQKLRKFTVAKNWIKSAIFKQWSRELV